MEIKNNEKNVLVAEIIEAHGIQGALKIKYYTQEAKDLEKMNLWFVNNKNSTTKENERLQIKLKVLNSNQSSSIANCKLQIIYNHSDGSTEEKSITDRTHAESLVKNQVFCNRSDFQEIEEEDVFYTLDLLNLPVFDHENQKIGEISNILNFGSTDIIEIEFTSTKKKEFYPFTNDFFPHVSKDRVVLDISNLQVC